MQVVRDDPDPRTRNDALQPLVSVVLVLRIAIIVIYTMTSRQRLNTRSWTPFPP
jgi:hypothetical protein